MIIKSEHFSLVTDEEILRNYYADKRLWQGIPSIALSRGGRIFVTFYSGGWCEDIGNVSFIIASDDDGATFSEPIVAAVPDSEHRTYDACLWLDPFGRLWYIFNLMPDHAAWASICDDPDADELVWSEPRIIGFDLMINKPIVLTTGEWLFPSAVWRRGMIVRGNPKLETKQPERGVFVFKTSDNGKTFTKHSHIVIPQVDFEEPMMLEQQDGMIRMLVRTTYGIGETYSYDRGKTWCPSFRSEIKGPASRFHITRLSSGRVMLINHWEFKNRDNLTVFLSEDDGVTWKYRLLLDERNEVSYPDAQEHNGFIYIVYDRERGDVKRTLDEVYGDAREILMAKVTEEDIIVGKPVNPQSRLKVIVNKLGEYHGDEPNPFFEIDRCADNAEAARMLAANFAKGDIPIKLFDTFPVKCANIRKVDTIRLDELIEEYEKTDGISIALIEQMIAIIRLSNGENSDFAPIINHIKAVVEDGLAEDISVNEISQRVGISRFYMAHLFKKHTGTTVSDYKNELKLTRAKRLLISGDTKISDIAFTCGFGSSSYFSKKFLECEGLTPGEYRKLHR
ncbi:MAG: exo-alpha-sialidase [Clostridia bacterium]|nr:exo-alpha-sialidase [Clostridia bacterium]